MSRCSTYRPWTLDGHGSSKANDNQNDIRTYDYDYYGSLPMIYVCYVY